MEDVGRFDIVGETVTLWGTIRTAVESDTAEVRRRPAALVGHSAAAYGATATAEYLQPVPPVHNGAAWAAAGPTTFRRVAGEERVVETGGTLGYDDVSEFVRRFGGPCVTLGTWRAAYVVAAAATAVLLCVLPRRLPERLGPPGERGGGSYARLLAGLPRLLAAHRELRVPALLGACAFAAFSVFWAVLAFHLASPPLGYGPGAAGLFGVLTLPAALLSAGAGPLADRCGTAAVGAGGLACAGLGLAVAGLFPYSPAALVAGANLLVAGVGSCQVANQAGIFGIGRAVAARVNTVFMLATFGGGAAGSLTGAWLYAAHGWRAALLAAGACVAVGGLVAVAAGVRPAVPTCVPAVTREAGVIHPRIPQGES
ncbi:MULTISPECIES: MFS transporter [unclassified Streptomyces]|uniref:MFS transporter n=1 Tax=unclassified Streptomyces TaxID=2593676 RepID=UPI00380C069C